MNLQNLFGNLGHICGGGWFVAGIVVIAHSTHPLRWWIPIGVGIALVKEFVVDILWEPPAISGMWWGGVLDFVGYAFGAAISLAVLWLAGWFA